MTLGDTSYLFTSARLGFRAWSLDDISGMEGLTADAHVMKYFPPITDSKYSVSFVKRMQQMFTDHGFCYYAVDRLADGEFIGFIGMAPQDYCTPFAPFIDIGWRLAYDAWGYGYATEGAHRCLEHAFDNLGMKEIYSIATASNLPSIRVMQKIGMKYKLTFDHPALLDFSNLKVCQAYHMDATLYRSIADSSRN